MIAVRLNDADRERIRQGIASQPDYVPQVKAAAAYLLRWRNDRPAAYLLWSDLTGTFLVAALDERGRGYLAISPDADECLRDLDAATGHVLTVMQAFFAISALGWVA